MPYRWNRTATLALASLCLALLPGCLFGTSRKTESSGTKIGDRTLAQVERGAEADYVLALLGEPSAKLDTPDGGELWKWSYREETSSRGKVLFLLSSTSKRESSGTVWVRFAPTGLVDEVWRD